MRRHPILIPLSRFHRSVLFLALLAKKEGPALKGYPSDWPGKRAYALQFYQDQLLPHFDREEKELFPLAAVQNAELEELVRILLEERRELAHYFEQLAQPDAPQAIFHKMGRLLEKHVRKEERQFFEQIQAAFTDKIWEQLNFEDA